MQVKLMWSAIAVIAIALLGIVIFTFGTDPNIKQETKQEEKEDGKETLPIKTEQEKDKKDYAKYIDKKLLNRRSTINNIDPFMLEYRYNKYFSELKIDRSIEFGPIKKRSHETSTDINDKISIHGVLNGDTMMFTKVDLIGFGLNTDKEFDEFREITLAFFTSIANQDVKGFLYQTMNFHDILKNGGESELIIGDIRYVLFGDNEEGVRLIRLMVTNINNSY